MATYIADRLVRLSAGCARNDGIERMADDTVRMRDIAACVPTGSIPRNRFNEVTPDTGAASHQLRSRRKCSTA